MSTQKNSIYVLTIFIMVALALLVPGLSFAGSIEPSDPPGPTMRTLDEIYSTNSWSKKLPCESMTNCPRFEVLTDFNNEAVLDKETGLVWQKSPTNYEGNWWHAQWQCVPRFTGGRPGWRVPTIHEFQSLTGECNNEYRLPCGHPFVNLNYCYWSSTEWPLDFNQAIYFCPNMGYSGPEDKHDLTGLANWCVRGGIGVELGISFHY